MPVGAIVGGVSGLAGAIIGGNKNSKAIGAASDAQAAATREATKLQRDIYNQNVGFQTPYLNTGNAAMGQINALLGLQVPQSAAPTPLGGSQPLDPAWSASALQSVMGDLSGSNNAGRGYKTAYQDYIGSHPVQYGENGSLDPAWAAGAMQAVLPHIQGNIRDNPDRDISQTFSNFLNANPIKYAAAQTNPSLGGTPADAQGAANAAYDRFKNYSGYTTRLNEGLNAINSGYAANGTLQSGAAMQALNKYGQDYASNEFQNYMGYLGGQQQLGPGAANALAGVGTNYANAAGNLAIQNGNNLANAAVAKANNFNNTMGNIAQVFSNAFGGMGGGF